jgi:hypothetical protein
LAFSLGFARPKSCSLSRFFERFAKVLHQEHPLQFVNRGRLKIKVFVELSGALIDRIDRNRTCPYNVGCVRDSQESVFQ